MSNTYFDEDNHLVGNFEKGPQNINFKVKSGISVHQAVLASVGISKQYKTPVRLICNGVDVEIPYNGTEPNIQNILTEYNKKILQQYR